MVRCSCWQSQARLQSSQIGKGASIFFVPRYQMFGGDRGQQDSGGGGGANYGKARVGRDDSKMSYWKYLNEVVAKPGTAEMEQMKASLQAANC